MSACRPLPPLIGWTQAGLLPSGPGPVALQTPKLSLDVERFGQAGTIGDLKRHYGIDAESIVRRVDKLTPGKPIGRRHSAAGDSRAVA